jgi:hypothetical protein
MMGTVKDLKQDLLVFSCSGMVCFFSLEAVREIVPLARLSSPPGLPAALALLGANEARLVAGYTATSQVRL